MLTALLDLEDFWAALFDLPAPLSDLKNTKYDATTIANTSTTTPTTINSCCLRLAGDMLPISCIPIVGGTAGPAGTVGVQPPGCGGLPAGMEPGWPGIGAGFTTGPGIAAGGGVP